MPFTAWGDGGSGRCSMIENRKANGQSVNAETLDGESERGTDSGTPLGYGRAVPSDRMAGPRSEAGPDIG